MLFRAARRDAAGGAREGLGCVVAPGGRAEGGEAGGHQERERGGHRRRPKTGGAVVPTVLAMPTSASRTFSHPRAQTEKPIVSLGAKFKMPSLCSYEVLLVCNLGYVKISTNTSGQKGKMDFGQLKSMIIGQKNLCR